MALLDSSLRGIRRANVPALLAGAALIGTYVLSRALDRTPGAQPAAPARPAAPRRDWPFWRDIVYRTYTAFNDDRLLALAAGVVFYAILALFPAITALVSSYALFAAPSTIIGHLALVASLVPQGAYSIIDEQATRIITRTTGHLSFTFLFGLVLALWSANAGVKAILDALNIAYGVKERRGFIRLNLVSLAFTVGAIAKLLLAIAVVVVLPIVLSFLPFSAVHDSVLTWARWPSLLVLLLLALALLYRFGPDVDNARFRWISPGAAFAALAWLGGSALLSWYLRSFADYDATYGSLGAAIALMMWMWMSAIVVLVGAELNAQIDKADRVPAQESDVPEVAVTKPRR
jgi:membrane protein